MTRSAVSMLLLTCLLAGCEKEKVGSGKLEVYIATSSNTGSYTRIVKDVFQNAIPNRIDELTRAITAAETDLAAGKLCATRDYTDCLTDYNERRDALKVELARLEALNFDQLEFKACKGRGSRFNRDVLRGKQEPLQPEDTESNLDDCTGKPVHFAIIQNDTAYRATKLPGDAPDGELPENLADYVGFKGLRAVLPLQPGYVHLVRPVKVAETPADQYLNPDSPEAGLKPIPLATAWNLAVSRKEEEARRASGQADGADEADPTSAEVGATEETDPSLTEGIQTEQENTAEPDETVQTPAPPSVRLGSRASANPRHASKLIEDERDGLGKRRYLDYEPLYAPDDEKNCNKYDVDFLMRSSNIQFKPDESDCTEHIFQHVIIPDSIVTKLVNAFDYYERAPVLQQQIDQGAPEELLSVTVYLMTTEDTNSEIVERVTSALVGAWPEMTREAARMEKSLNLLPLKESVQREPVAYHDGAYRVFLAQDLRTDTRWNLMVFLLSVGMIATVVIATYFQSTYGRMGTILRTSFLQRTADRIVAGAFWVLLIAIAGIALSAAITGLQYVEQVAARESNTINKFASIDFVDAFVWIFTFMVSGYENDIYPQSVPGRVLISIIALLGLIVPLTGIYRGFNSARDRRSLHSRGLASYEQFHNHIVICGWNAKGTGIVWSLSGDDGLTQKDIVIVSVFDEDEPLSTRNFNKRVHYSRGDPTDRDSLIRAGVNNASAVVVLASDREESKHIGSAITALAVREMNPNAFLIAEQVELGDELYLASADVDAIVHPEEIANGITTSAILNPCLPDFLLDALTIDQFAEWYAIGDTSRRRGWTKNLVALPMSQVRAVARGHGVNVIARSSLQESRSIKMLSANEEHEMSHIDLLLDPESDKQILRSEDHLICAAEDRSMFSGSRRLAAKSPPTDSRERLLDTATRQHRIVVTGQKRRTDAVRDAIISMHPALEVHTFSFQSIDEVADDHFIETVREYRPEIVVMLGQPIGVSALNTDFTDSLDEHTILRTKMLRDSLEDDVQIVTELHNLSNRSLLLAAGANTIVPVTLIAERFITRLAISKGSISETLYSMFDTRSNYVLQSITLNADHPLSGVDFDIALSTRYADGRVLAALPHHLRDELVNDQRDFSTHFAMSVRDKEPFALTAGDEVILLTRKTSIKNH